MRKYILRETALCSLIPCFYCKDSTMVNNGAIISVSAKNGTITANANSRKLELSVVLHLLGTSY